MHLPTPHTETESSSSSIQPTMVDDAASEDTQWAVEKESLGLVEEARFWIGQVIHWTTFSFITLLYVPWAFAMHLLLLALAIPLAPVCVWRTGRKLFVYFYVLTVMIPGKYIWHRAFMHTKRRANVYDYEKGRPRPIPLESRRRMSTELARTDQSKSSFLTKLPVELRMLVYSEIFVGNSLHMHIIQRRIPGTHTKAPTTKIRGYLCAREHGQQQDANCPCLVGAHAHHDPPLPQEIWLPKGYNRGKLPLLLSCKQVYSEAITQLYREPKFCFNNLDQPPFFLRSVLPNRLAMIQRIQIVYKQSTMTSQPRRTGSTIIKYRHAVQQCTFCNPNRWFELMRMYMTGLKQIEIFLYLDKKRPAPHLGTQWVQRLLALQRGPLGIRTMRVQVFCNADLVAGVHSDYRKQVKEFVKGIKRELTRREAKRPIPLQIAESRPTPTPTSATNTEETASVANSMSVDPLVGLGISELMDSFSCAGD